MKFINKKIAAVALVAASAFVTSSAMAAGELVAEVTSATASAKTDIGTAGVAIVGVVVAIAVIAWIRKVIR